LPPIVNSAFYIAKRIAFSKNKSFSRFIIRLSIAAVALSIAVMIISTALITGFQKEIKNKMFNFWGHIHITKFNNSLSLEDLEPVELNQAFYPSLSGMDDIDHIQPYIKKASILKTNDDFEGIFLRGVDQNFKWAYQNEFFQSGKGLTITDSATSNGIVLSEYTSKRLKLKVGDNAFLYFIRPEANASSRPLIRKVEVSGIYKTGMEEFDKMWAIVDIKMLQRLNQWKANEVGGFEVYVNNIDEIDKVGEYIYYDVLGPTLHSATIKEIYPTIIDWLNLQRFNEKAIIILMIIVAIINMITGLLILILDRTNMIGVLKAIGASNGFVVRVFMLNAAYIIGIGLLIGNVLGLALCLIQKHFEIIKLPEASYYLSAAPIHLSLTTIVLLNIGSMIVICAFMLLPALFVSRITPVKAIRFA